MNKIINWLFGSFFRTLGRILVYILLGLVLSYLLKDLKIPKINISNLVFMNVHAFQSEYYYTLNNTKLSTGTKVYTAGNSNMTLLLKTPNDATIDSEIYTFGYIALCSAFGSMSNRYINTASSGSFKNITIYNTTTGCTIPGTNDYINTARVVYFTFEVPESLYTGSVSGTSSYLPDNVGLAFYQPGSNEFSLVGYDFGYNAYDFSSQVDNSDRIIEIQNQNTNSIINNQTNNTNSIINNQNSNSQAQIDNANQNKQDIINNQNANSQAQIDNANANTDKTIDSQKVCETIEISYKDIEIEDKLLTTTGTEYSNSSYGITKYFDIKNVTNITIKSQASSSTASYCFYDSTKTLLNCTNLQNINTISVPNNANYFRSSINTNVNRPIYEYTQCKNGNQAMNDYLTDDTAPNSDISSLGTVQGLLPPGPVDSLLNIPVAFLSVITSSMSGTCTPLQGDFVYGSTLSIPCFGEMIYDNNSIPPVLMLFINVIPSAFILIEYFKHLYKKVDRAVSMDATADDDWGVI